MNSIIGADRLAKKFIKLADGVADKEFLNIVRTVNKGVVQANAKLLCPVNHGELRASISEKAEQTSTGIRAMTYTNKESASYVEFGTGPRGEASHEGISPEVNPTYSQHGWGIPVDKIDPADAEKYHWGKRLYNGKEYYMTSGQPAQPFLYPALKNNEEVVTSQISRRLVSKIRKEARK